MLELTSSDPWCLEEDYDGENVLLDLKILENLRA